MTDFAASLEWADAISDPEIARECMDLWRRDRSPTERNPTSYLPEASDTVAARRLMKRFVSLGDNCEFGFAQRAFGAEPLDLLRWAATPISILIDLLNQRFEEIGAPQHIRVRAAPNGEYMVDHLRYRFTWHAFAQVGSVEPTLLHRRECMRLPRLAEMLVDELTEGSRICVIKGPTILSAENVERVQEALRRYGNPELLFVTRQDDTNRAGTAIRRSQNLIQGFVEKFADPAHVPATTDTMTWYRVCGQAVELAES